MDYPNKGEKMKLTQILEWMFVIAATALSISYVSKLATELNKVHIFLDRLDDKMNCNEKTCWIYKK